MQGRRPAGPGLARFATLAGLALLLTGCLKLDIDLRVQPDDTVDGAVVFAVDKDLLDLTGGSIEDLTQGEQPFPSDFEGVKIEPYEEGDWVGQRYRFDGAPLTAFADTADPDSLKIVRAGDTFRVSGALDLSAPAGATGPDPSAFFSSAEIRVAVTFPGEVISANGEIDGNTVTWEPRFGERLEMEATGSAIPSGGGPGALTIALLVVGVAALAGILALVTASRRRAAPALAVSGAGEDAAGATAEAARGEGAGQASVGAVGEGQAEEVGQGSTETADGGPAAGEETPEEPPEGPPPNEIPPPPPPPGP